MIPKHFAWDVLKECLVDIYGPKEGVEMFGRMPKPTREERKAGEIYDLIQFVNTDNRYKLCCVNRRTTKWAVYILSPYGVVNTREICYAFCWQYDETTDSAIFSDTEALIKTLNNLGFNRTAIKDSFLDL